MPHVRHTCILFVDVATYKRYGIITTPEGTMYVGNFKYGISDNPVYSEERKNDQGNAFLQWVQKDGGEKTIQLAKNLLKEENGRRSLGLYCYRSVLTDKWEHWASPQMSNGPEKSPEISHLSVKLDLIGRVPHVLTITNAGDQAKALGGQESSGPYARTTRALKNYEIYHSMKEGTANSAMVEQSKHPVAGIHGWSEYVQMKSMPGEAS